MVRSLRVPWLFALGACVCLLALGVPVQRSVGEENPEFEEMPDIGPKARMVFEKLLTFYQEVAMGEMTRLWTEAEATADDARAIRDVSQQALATAEHRIDAARGHWSVLAKRRGLPEASWEVLPKPWEEWIRAHQRFIGNAGGSFMHAMQAKVEIVAKEEVLDTSAENDTDRWESYVEALVTLNKDLEEAERLCDQIVQGGSGVAADRKALARLLPRLYVGQAALMNWAVVIDDMQKRGYELLAGDEWTAQAVKDRMQELFAADTPTMKGSWARLDSSMLAAFHDWEKAAEEHVKKYTESREKFETFSKYWMGGDRDLFPAELLSGRTGWDVLESFRKVLRRAEHYAK